MQPTADPTTPVMEAAYDALRDLMAAHWQRRSAQKSEENARVKFAAALAALNRATTTAQQMSAQDLVAEHRGWAENLTDAYTSGNGAR